MSKSLDAWSSGVRSRNCCPDCGHEYLLAFSCKGRYFCTSCHTKRAAAFAEWLHTTILLPVPHRQIVLTIPKMLRIYFRYDRRLLGDLCRVAAGVIVESFRVLLAVPQAQVARSDLADVRESGPGRIPFSAPVLRVEDHG
jgi:hypothetical protein